MIAGLTKGSDKGFTLVELMVVIIILGVLATIAIAVFTNLTQRAHVATIESDLVSAYKASILFFNENPGGEITGVDILIANGYVRTEPVAIVITNGFADTLIITATHPALAGVYQVNHRGEISHP
jgi:prepilin-type N-terminal cleavage/methylation domain-containing protein